MLTLLFISVAIWVLSYALEHAANVARLIRSSNVKLRKPIAFKAIDKVESVAEYLREIGATMIFIAVIWVIVYVVNLL